MERSNHAIRTLDACGKHILAAAAALAVLASFGTAHARFRVLYSFGAGNDGVFPYAGLIKDSAGNLYGTTYEGGGAGCGGSGCGTVFEVAPDGTEPVLYAFAGGNDGAFPGGGLIKDSAGNLFGTTAWGGSTSCNNGSGCG